MSPMEYVKAEPISLKDHPEYTEKWLENLIAEDPSILGLGDVVLIERQRRQGKARRLDLLLQGPDQDRYEVELMLGPTDESHVIRCIEYWDIERRRYPGYDHSPVLIAEDITSRFLNILGLFAGTIPLIAMQLRVLEVEGKVAVDFVRVIDRVALRTDDEGEGRMPAADRPYWETKAPATVGMVDTFLDIINEKADPKLSLNYNKGYIGMMDGARSRNFVHFAPKKKFLRLMVEVSDTAGWVARVEEAGLEVSVRRRFVRVILTPKELAPNRELLAELIHQGVEEYQSS